MKLTNKQLRKMIKEELKEAEGHVFGVENPEDRDYGEVAVRNAWNQSKLGSDPVIKLKKAVREAIRAAKEAEVRVDHIANVLSEEIEYIEDI